MGEHSLIAFALKVAGTLSTEPTSMGKRPCHAGFALQALEVVYTAAHGRPPRGDDAYNPSAAHTALCGDGDGDGKRDPHAASESESASDIDIAIDMTTENHAAAIGGDTTSNNDDTGDDTDIENKNPEQEVEQLQEWQKDLRSMLSSTFPEWESFNNNNFSKLIAPQRFELGGYKPQRQPAVPSMGDLAVLGGGGGGGGQLISGQELLSMLRNLSFSGGITPGGRMFG